MALKTIWNEINTYKKLSHPYIIKLIEFQENAIWIKSKDKKVPVAIMVLELVTKGELFDYIHYKSFPPEVCRYYFRQML